MGRGDNGRRGRDRGGKGRRSASTPREVSINFYNRCLYCTLCKKGKGSPYSITERRVPELIPVLGSQHAGDVSHKPPAVGCHYFPPGLQLPLQLLRGLLPILLLGEQRHDGYDCGRLLPDSVAAVI